MIVEKVGEGYLMVSAWVQDNGETWLHRQRFLYYTKREAVRLFKENVKAQGWVIGK
jgi:hypothetical protein